MPLFSESLIWAKTINVTGCYLINIDGSHHLLKLYFMDGKISDVKYWKFRGIECIKEIPSNKIKSASFMNASKSVYEMSDDEIVQLHDFFSSMVVNDKIGGVGASVKVEHKESGIIGKIEKQLFEVVGPIGGLLLEDSLKKIGKNKSSQLNSGELDAVIEELMKSMDSNSAQKFLKSIGR